MAGKVVQMDFFAKEKLEYQLLEFEDFKKLTEKSIRGLYARYNEIERIVLEMNANMSNLKDVMCEIVNK